MTINFTKVQFSSEKEKEIFPSEMEGNPVLISLDSRRINGVHGKVYDDSDDVIRDYLIREMDSGALGTYYNWFITRNGRIYLITPSNKAGHSCVFSLYSSRMSMALPKMCPLQRMDVSDLSNIPDKKIISICVEESADEESDKISPQQEASLKQLLAYYFKNVEGLAPKSVINRKQITREERVQESLGCKAYEDIADMVVLTSYALMTARKESTIILEPDEIVGELAI